METQLTFFLALAVGLVFGGLAVWLMLRADASSAYGRARAEFAAEMGKLNERLNGQTARIEDLTKDRDHLRAEIEKHRREVAELTAVKAKLETRLTESEKVAQEKLEAVARAQDSLADTFKALSAEALNSNNQAFLSLAQTALERFQEGARTDLQGRQKAIGEMVQPIRDSLGQVERNLQEIEKSRAAAYAGITEQVRSLLETQNALRSETSNLVNALRTPTVRGRWGELQLRRVVDMAGMAPYCDFEEQASVDTQNGRQRPDMVVRLPNGRQVVVDAKVSLKAYLEALEATDEATRQQKLAEHAAQIRAHLQRLGSKAYWEQFAGAPEFAVAFLPGEVFFSAALEKDPELIEYGVDNKVILATPTTLIALLKAVAYGWRQEKLARNTEEISTIGKLLYDRLCTFTEHMETMRGNLQRTVDSYNKAAGSLESRVLVSARRFQDLGTSQDRELPPLEPVDNFPRSLRAAGRALAAGGAVEEAVESDSSDEPDEDDSSDGPPVVSAGEGQTGDAASEAAEQSGAAGEPVESLTEAESEQEEEEEPATAQLSRSSEQLFALVPLSAPETASASPSENGAEQAAEDAGKQESNQRQDDYRINYLAFVKAM